jgi:acetate kinase
VNAGSSSTKLRVVVDEESVAGTDLAATDAGDATARGLRSAILALAPVDAVGHRIVHGGTEYREATKIDDVIIERLAALADLAPLHQPASVAALRTARAALPEQPHVACFDTAFHATISDAAATYALPRAWRERWPIRRFGFHGLSHASAAGRAAEILRRPLEDLRLVTAHLGAGASLAAVAGGRSVDTTMGFTPLEGLVMATRSGSVDPGLMLWLLEGGGLSVDELAHGLEREAGLFGLAGTADMRELLAAADAGSDGARLAREVYVHRLRGAIAAMAATMDGLDALAFTGGVGENAAAIRELAVRGLAFLGLEIDPGSNADGTGDREIGRPGAPAGIVVVASREEAEIARGVRSVLGTA